MQFKTIDQLTDDELESRIENGVEAAEAIFEDGHKEVAELIMRMIPRLKKQLAKRQDD